MSIPIVSFTYEVDPITNEVVFTDTSTGSPTSWDWDFGDYSEHSTEQNPTYLYAETGTYIVTLTATNDDGSDSIAFAVNVHDSGGGSYPAPLIGRSYLKIPYKAEYGFMNTGNFKVSFDLYRDDLTNEIIIFSRSLTATPETPHFYFSSKDDKIYVVIIEGEYAIIEYCNVVSAGVRVNIKISYDTYYWKLFKNDVEVAPTSPVVTGIADDSASNSYFVNAVEPIPNTACNFLLQNLKIYSDYIPPPVTYLSLWKGEDNGNNETAGKPLAVWYNSHAYADGKVGRCFSLIDSGYQLTIATDPTYDLTQYNMATLAFWFKPITISIDEVGLLFLMYRDGGMLSLKYKYPDILIVWNVGMGGGTETEYPGVLTAGEWIAIKWVYEKATNLWNLCTSTDEVTWTLIATADRGEPTAAPVTFGIGGYNNDPLLIDEIKITDSGEIPPVPPVPDFSGLFNWFSNNYMEVGG